MLPSKQGVASPPFQRGIKAVEAHGRVYSSQLVECDDGSAGMSTYYSMCAWLWGGFLFLFISFLLLMVQLARLIASRLQASREMTSL